MFKTFFIFVICTLCVSARSQPATKPDSTVADVEIDNFTFKPQRLVIYKGTRVHWINKDDVPHTATSNDKKFDSKAMDTDESFTFQFDDTGLFKYFCAVHPHMTGEILVKE